jgi:hypothetical protein
VLYQNFGVIQGRLVFEVKPVGKEGFARLCLYGLSNNGLAISDIGNDGP